MTPLTRTQRDFVRRFHREGYSPNALASALYEGGTMRS